MFMGWTEKDREELMHGLRALVGFPFMTILVMLSLGDANEVHIPWNPVTFFAGLGLALILKLIEVIIYKIRKY